MMIWNYLYYYNIKDKKGKVVICQVKKKMNTENR